MQIIIMLTITTARQSFITAIIEACGLKAQLDYLDQAHTELSMPLIIGTLFHDTMAEFFTAMTEQRVPTMLQTLDMLHAHYENIASQAPASIDMIQVLQDTTACIVHYYATACTVRDPIRAEVNGERLINDVRVTTHLDLETSHGIIELKTARVGVRRDRTEYLLDYNPRSVQWRTQPLVHMALFGAQPYEYHVAGKGTKVLIERLPVYHTQRYVDQWTERILVPVIEQIKTGIFPARLSGLCSVCSYADKPHYCGLGKEGSLSDD